ncbi:hypothetical protein FO519_007636 [Halicephalobus sp. NKZ332]|nr:hypothetical protein FO519_007636 [Halicephalobus sp. NKZ332]
MFPCMTLDRLIATRNPEEYEKKTKPRIAIILVFISIILGLGIQAFVVLGTFSLTTMPIVLAGINFIGTVMMYFIVKKNNLNMDYYYNFALGHRLQLRENIRTCAAIYPILIMSSVSTIIGALLYAGAVWIEDVSLSLLFITVVNTGIALYMNAATLMTFFFIKKIREKIRTYLCYYGRVRSENLNTNEVYFKQLQAQWN